MFTLLVEGEHAKKREIEATSRPGKLRGTHFVFGASLFKHTPIPWEEKQTHGDEVAHSTLQTHIDEVAHPTLQTHSD